MTLSKRELLSALVGLCAFPTIGAASQPRSARLVLVHGRGQAKQDPKKLKDAWLEALTIGAKKIGMQIPDNIDVQLPFYGDILQNFIDLADLPTTGDIKSRGGSGQDDSFLAFQADVAQSIRERAGISDALILQEYGDNPRPRGPLNWEWVQAILAAIDKYGGGLSQDAIERFTRDVYLYLTYPAARLAVNDTVRSALSDQPTVVVAHSLGSVVMYDVLRTESRKVNVPLFVTVGSPLGIRAIRDQLAPITHPRGVKDWFNAFDTRDVVALFPLDQRSFSVSPPIRNFAGVKNHTENRHGIAGYLDDRDVAQAVLSGING